MGSGFPGLTPPPWAPEPTQLRQVAPRPVHGLHTPVPGEPGASSSLSPAGPCPPSAARLPRPVGDRTQPFLPWEGCSAAAAPTFRGKTSRPGHREVKEPMQVTQQVQAASLQ